MEVKVTFDCSERIEQLVQETLCVALQICGGSTVEQTPHTNLAQEVTDSAKPTKPVEKKKRSTKKTEEKTEETKVEETPADNNPDEAPEPIEVPESAKEAPVMEPQDVRQAMLDTYKRLEDSVSDELKSSVHEQAKEIFKELCKRFGVNKPSQLPDGATRWEFVNQLNGVTVTESGEVTPF